MPILHGRNLCWTAVQYGLLHRTMRRTDHYRSLSDASCDRWYVMQVHTARQHIAIENLERQGFTTFVPLISRSKRQRGAPVDVLEPLFPGYAFVRFDVESARWRSINGTLGVLRLVSFGERPQALPIGFVETLMESADERGAVSFDDPLGIGDRVRVVGGAFHDLIGTLVAARSRDRLIVMLGLLGGAAPVELEAERLIRA